MGLLFLPHAVGFDGPAFRVGQEDEGQIVLLGELHVGRYGIPAHADHRHVIVPKGGIGPGEGAGLAGAAGGVVLGIEVEDHLRPQKIRQLYDVSVLVRQLKQRRFLACFQHDLILPNPVFSSVYRLFVPLTRWAEAPSVKKRCRKFAKNTLQL